MKTAVAGVRVSDRWGYASKDSVVLLNWRLPLLLLLLLLLLALLIHFTTRRFIMSC